MKGTAVIVGSLGLLVAGCDSRPSSSSAPVGNSTIRNERGLRADHMPVSPQSEALRGQFKALGAEIPELRVVLRRKGREFPGFEVNAQDAIATWERLRALTDRTGYYPLVVRDEYGKLTAIPDDDIEQTPEAVLAAAKSLDVDQWLASQRAGRSRYDADATMPRRPGASAEPRREFAVPLDGKTGKPAPGVFLVLLPTRDGTEFPALLMFGTWNACTSPEVNVAVLRRWRERYGAEPVTLSGDVIELRASRAPATLEEAIVLAEEQYLYCSDALASSLLKESIWFFWWD